MTSRAGCARVLIWILTVCLLLPDGRALAEDPWFTSFMDNVVVNDPAMWTTQKRGYMALGGISYRNPKNREPLVTITAPRFQAGCGGIDAFWGGLSYLQPEYIIKAAENIMAAAPGYAFKLALKTLCEQCDNAWTALEGLSNAVNALAMDDCKAAQGLVNFGGDAIASSLDALGVQGLSANGNWMADKIGQATKSVADWTTQLNDILDWQYCGGLGNHDNATAKCKDALMPQGSMWDKALKDEGDFLPPLIRGMFGDLLFSPPGGKNSGDASDKPGRSAGIEYVESCDFNAKDYMKSFMSTDSSSDFKVRTRSYSSTTNTTGACTDVSLPSGMKIGQRAENALNDLTDKMTSNPTGALNADTVTMIGQSTFPIYQILNAYTYRYRDSGEAISQNEKTALTRLIAVGHIHYLLQKIVTRSNVMLVKQSAKLMNVGKVTGIDNTKLQGNVNSMQKSIADFQDALRHEYSDAVRGYKDQMTEILNYQNMKRQLMSVLRNKGLTAAYWGP